jgi:toxin ParE1/3/4
VIWPEAFALRAVRDVEEAADWIADHGGGPLIARRMVLATLDAARFVVGRPRAGHTRPNLLPVQFRFWRVRGFPYLLVYDAERTPAQIVRVPHAARDLEPVLADVRSIPDEAAPT